MRFFFELGKSRCLGVAATKVLPSSRRWKAERETAGGFAAPFVGGFGCCSAAFVALLPMLLLTGCKSAPPQARVAASQAANAFHYAARPTVAAPAFKLFHQDNDTFTLVTKDDASQDEVATLLWEFRDAARDRSFAALHLPQTFVDARKPTVWIHVYRGSKCASEKFTKGKLPCEASYHGAGDFTLGDYKNPQWSDGELHKADGTEIHLWDPDAPNNGPSASR